MFPLNITFLYNILYRITIRSMKNLFVHKKLTSKTIKKKKSVSPQSLAKRKKKFLQGKKKSALNFIN